MIVREARASHYPWLLGRIGYVASPIFRAIEAVRADGEIAGMFGYDFWTHNAVHMHVAIDDPRATRLLLRHGLHYPFVLEGLDVVLAEIPADRAAALRFATWAGMREVHRVRDGWARGVDLVLLEMRRDECRWF